MKNVEHHQDSCTENARDAADFTSAPACPPWCTRPDLPAQGHHAEWDFDEEDGHVSRNHSRTYGDHVVLVGWETSAVPGVVQDHRIQVHAVEGQRLSYADAIRLAAALLQAAAALDEMGAGR